jgi:hypothetical protein
MPVAVSMPGEAAEEPDGGREMDATTPTASTGWAVAAIVIFLLLWLTPLFHASRGGRALPVIEVLSLLGAALLPVAAGAFTAGPPFVGSRAPSALRTRQEVRCVMSEASPEGGCGREMGRSSLLPCCVE